MNLTPAQTRCVEALIAHGGNRTAASASLAMNHRAFLRRLGEAEKNGWDPATAPPAKAAAAPRRVMIAISELVLRDYLQPREQINPLHVNEYAELYRTHGPEAMAPIRAYRDAEGAAILTRGFTRVAGARLADLSHLPCELYPTANTYCLLIDSLGGNRHGQPLTTADKRRALKLYHDAILPDDWMPTRDLAKHIGCSHELVAAFRRELEAGNAPPVPTPPPLTPAATPAEPPLSDSDKTVANGEPEDLVPDDDGAGDTAAVEPNGDDKPTEPHAKIQLAAGTTKADGIGTPEPPKPPKPLSERRLDRVRMLLCARITERPTFAVSAAPNRIALLMLICGLESDLFAKWNDANLTDSISRFEAAVGQRVCQEICDLNPALPDLATLATLFDLDIASLEIQAERAIPV